MKQVWSFLSAIFAPLGSLVRVVEVILGWLAKLEAELDDPDYVHELQTQPHSRRVFEGAIAFAEILANLLVTCRTAELLGIPRRSLDLVLPRKHWKPAKARSWRDLMLRYARMKYAFATVERAARRRAARLRREIARGDVTGLVALVAHAHLVCAPVAALCAIVARFVARVAPQMRGPPPVIVAAASV